MNRRDVWNAEADFPLESKQEILDLFDVYCDVQETLLEEGLKSSV